MKTDALDSLTFLEFGSINLNNSSKSIWDFRLHQEAYDFFMLARYMKDLMIFRKLAREGTTQTLADGLRDYKAGVYTQDIYNSFTKLAALHIAATELAPGTAPRFVELGSTLMGCIDAIRYLQIAGGATDPNFSGLDLHQVDWCGIDISQLLNDVAEALYPSYSLATSLHHEAFAGNADVFFAKGVSLLYAFEQEEQLIDYLVRSRIAVFDYSFALGDKQREILGTGKPVTYLSLSGVMQGLRDRASGKELFFDEQTLQLDRSKNRIRTLCYCGEPKTVHRTVAEERRLRGIVLNQLPVSELRALLFYGGKESASMESVRSGADVLERLKADG